MEPHRATRGRLDQTDGRAMSPHLMLSGIQKDGIAVNVMNSTNLERGLAGALEAGENVCDH
jgi:hypothetical protein